MGSDPQANSEKSKQVVIGKHSLRSGSFVFASLCCHRFFTIDFVGECAIANHSSNLGREREVGSLYKSSPHRRITADTAYWFQDRQAASAQKRVGDYPGKWRASIPFVGERCGDWDSTEGASIDCRRQVSLAPLR